MALAPLSGPSSTDVDMRTSSKRGFLDVESDPGLLSSYKTVDTVNKMDTKLDAKLDTKFEGLEDGSDDWGPPDPVGHARAELASQRQLLEDLRSEVSSLRSNSSGPGSTGSISPGRGAFTSSLGMFPSVYDWQPQSVQVCGWAPFGSRPNAKIDRTEYKKLSEELVKLLPDCLRNQVAFRCKLPVSVAGISAKKFVMC